MKQLGWVPKAMGPQTTLLGSYLRQKYFDDKNPWMSLVTGDPLLEAILNKPKSSNVAPYDNERPQGIIRFAVACYSHSNDFEYKGERQGKAYLEDHEVEKRLNRIFPNIYIWIKEGLLSIALKDTGVATLLTNWIGIRHLI
jgi:hypothetical protein